MEHQAGLPEPSVAPDAPRSIEDIAAEAMEVAERRATDRAAGREVLKALPDLAPRRGEAPARSAERPARAAPTTGRPASAD